MERSARINILRKAFVTDESGAVIKSWSGRLFELSTSVLPVPSLVSFSRDVVLKVNRGGWQGVTLSPKLFRAKHLILPEETFPSLVGKSASF